MVGQTCGGGCISLQRLRNQSPEYSRLIGYKVKVPGFDHNGDRTLLNDLAPTIGVHPTALGMLNECHGQVIVPPLFELRIREVKNVCLPLDSTAGDEDPGRPTLGGRGVSEPVPTGFVERGLTGDAAIPPLLLKMHLQRDEGNAERIRAVVVLEHRNLKAAIDRISHLLNGIERCIFVLVSPSEFVPPRGPTDLYHIDWRLC